MELIAFLEALRTDYMVQYEAAYHEHVALNEEVFPEISFEISGSVFKQLFTIDFLLRNDGHDEVREITPTEEAYGPEGSFQFNEIKVQADSVSWDAVVFTLLPAPADIGGFEAWFDRWMDIEREHSPVDDEYGHSIHSVILGGNTVSVDFGTAPVRAALELLSVFDESGVRLVHLSSGRDDAFGRDL